MKKTKLAALAATLVLTLTFGSVAIAEAWGGHGGGCRYGNGGGYGYGGGYGHGGYGPGPQAMSQEQRNLYNDYDKKAGPLVGRLRAKQAELDALYMQGEPDRTKSQALAKEIGDLQGQLYGIDAEFGAKMRSEGYAGGGYGWRHNGGGYRHYGGGWDGYGRHHGGHR